jgi:hypothetical protein
LLKSVTLFREFLFDKWTDFGGSKDWLGWNFCISDFFGSSRECDEVWVLLKLFIVYSGLKFIFSIPESN